MCFFFITFALVPSKYHVIVHLVPGFCTIRTRHLYCPYTICIRALNMVFTNRKGYIYKR